LAELRSRDIAARAAVRACQHVKMIPEMTVLENVALSAHHPRQQALSTVILRQTSEKQFLPRSALVNERISRRFCSTSQQSGDGAAVG
jgi:ABC-type branched-subunit amino acid transport system ATPase component